MLNIMLNVLITV